MPIKCAECDAKFTAREHPDLGYPALCATCALDARKESEEECARLAGEVKDLQAELHQVEEYLQNARCDSSGEEEDDAPPLIWLQWHGDADPDEPGHPEEITWCQDRIFSYDIPYVRVDVPNTELVDDADRH